MPRHPSAPASDSNVNSSAQSDRDASTLVPSRRQYLDLKALHPNAILLYRLGDFYESFDDDAAAVARDARISLTSRSFGRNGRVPMAGIPHHALNHYLGRLLGAGHTVAIAEQVSEAGRGLVDRAVTRVVTPGTVAEGGLLPAGENRYLAAVAPHGERMGLAWVDVSTGEFTTLELNGPDALSRLADELARIDPAECLIPDSADPDFVVSGHRTRLPRWHFDPDRAAAVLRRQFGVVSLSAYGSEELPAAVGAAGAIAGYLAQTNPTLLRLLVSLRTELPARYVGLDSASRRNLELTRSHRTGGSNGSLLGVLDRTRTSMGARMLRRMVGQPLRDIVEIERRQELVAALLDRPVLRASLGQHLRETGDLERLMGRISRRQSAVRDFWLLMSALKVVPELSDSLASSGDRTLCAFGRDLDSCSEILDILERAVNEDEEGSVHIRRGFSPELDRAVDGARNTREWIANLESMERQRTGIRSLKVGYNKIFGYYIEVTRPNLSLVPAEYTRKQTVATGERYITTGLKEAESRLLASDEHISALERAMLDCLATEVTAVAVRIMGTANRLAELDALLSLAEVAEQGQWVRPQLDQGDALKIIGGRHPVVEANLSGDPFIPNDCALGGDDARALIVTGPNMGGKSTYLRQVALIVLLSQIGSFVPAASANVGIVDRIFTRVGAHDDLAGGRSTFMVEMVETATILHQATRRSLVILDEVGRGTSTDDGLAIAQAVLEDLHDRVGARTLFATHYLELTSLPGRLHAVGNAHVAALESGDRVVFLYAVSPGPADRAYGIHVARLAGLPTWVADRALAVLADMTSSTSSSAADLQAAGLDIQRNAVGDGANYPFQLGLDGIPGQPLPADRLARELRGLDLDALSPRDAMEWLFEQQQRL